MDTDRKASESMRALEALQEQPEWLRVSLSSIGDAVILTFLKPGGSVLDRLEARGRSEEAAGRGFQDDQ